MTFRRKRHPAAEHPCTCCSCSAQCPEVECTYRCLGGHANYPENHWCVNLHQWTTARPDPACTEHASP